MEDYVHEQLPVRREKVSVDDFEHLGLDNNSPTQGDEELATSVVNSAARDLLGEIDKTAENVVSSKIDEVRDKQPPESLFDYKTHKMDSNLYEKGDTLLEKTADSDEKLDRFIASFAPPVPSHEVSPIIEDRKLPTHQYDGIKNFLDMERETETNNEQPILEPVKKLVKELDLTEPVNVIIDDFKSSDADLQYDPSPEIIHSAKPEIPPPILDEPVFESVVPPPPVTKVIEPVVTETVVEPPQTHPKTSPQVESYTPSAPKHVPEPAEHHVTTQPKIESTSNKAIIPDFHLEPTHTDAEAIFKKMGLDAWFHPERLNPRVESLIYWRDPTKSGPVFGGVLVVLLALTYLSLISVIAYVSLLALTATISFRIYKNVLQAVQKTGDGHPFKEFLDKDITLPQDKVKECVETAIAHANAAAVELRRLFLVDDLVDSIKFGVLLWCLTYLGAWFNGMTLVIIAWVALFTLPKVYETNKTQIDANLDLVRSKIAEITSKVKAAIPIGKKEDKKEQ